jgi:hypothetical protein
MSANKRNVTVNRSTKTSIKEVRNCEVWVSGQILLYEIVAQGAKNET